MTAKQIKRDFKKYLVDTGVQFISKNGNFKIGLFILTFSEDYVFVYTPTLSTVSHICISYETPQKTLGKVVLWHMRLHKKGIHITGRVRTAHVGKRKEFIYK